MEASNKKAPSYVSPREGRDFNKLAGGFSVSGSKGPVSSEDVLAIFETRIAEVVAMLREEMSSPAVEVESVEKPTTDLVFDYWLVQGVQDDGVEPTYVTDKAEDEDGDTSLLYTVEENQAMRFYSLDSVEAFMDDYWAIYNEGPSIVGRRY